MRKLPTLTLAAALAALIFAGCQPGDPLDRKVKAGSANALASWRAHVSSDYSPENRRRVDEALQEIRIKFAAEREVKRVLGEPIPTGTESIDEAVRDKIHERPLREVLQLGYELRLRRLTAELAGLEDAMGKNAQLTTRPGDVESKHHLEGLRDRQAIRLDKYREDIAKAERELEPLLKASGRRLLSPEAPNPEAEAAQSMPKRLPK